MMDKLRLRVLDTGETKPHTWYLYANLTKEDGMAINYPYPHAVVLERHLYADLWELVPIEPPKEGK
jgi:hypothetical protein